MVQSGNRLILFGYKNVLDSSRVLFQISRIHVARRHYKQRCNTAPKSIFVRHGIPDQVISDGGPQYSSQKFREFFQAWQFKHVKSSPGYAQSNGMAETTIQTVKQLLKKAIKSK